MLRKIQLVVSTMALLASLATAQTESVPSVETTTNNLLQAALDSIGIDQSDLGIRPKGYWNRFPTDIPYVNKAFYDLLAEPLMLYDYGKSFGGAASVYMDPARLDSLDDNLYHLTYFLGVERITGGMRSYGANVLDTPPGETPFLDAIEYIYALGDEHTAPYSFNRKSEWTDVRGAYADSVLDVPLPLRQALAKLIVNLGDAARWRKTAFRNVEARDMLDVFYIRDLAETQGDGLKYYAAIDDIAAVIDWPSLWYGALKVAAALEEFEKDCTEGGDISPDLKEIPSNWSLDIPTPLGTILLRGHGRHTTHCDNTFLVIDFGGNDTYSGAIGATSRPGHGLSVCLDLDGDDVYEQKAGNVPSCGVGIMGIGVLYDAAGSDRYTGTVFAQGAGFFGYGILFDKDGADSYTADVSAQGCGYFGIGLALDCAGDDRYYLYGDGQGMGGIGNGIGCLADYSGDDEYKAEPLASVYNRGDYHSENKINANNAQGAGFGRRGDGSDGHSWAGGVGAIVDILGDDTYISGNWSLGTGYWFATGICYDGSGDDEYHSVYFTQASGAHFCNGVLIDESGDDKHILTETAGAAFGFGWDYTNALFVDRAGNDTYDAGRISYGLSQIRSFAFFFDMAGADTYRYTAGQEGFGAATFRHNYSHPTPLLTYYYYSTSAGIFIDASGTDSYIERDGDTETAAETYRNNAVWYIPAKDDSSWVYNNYGIGIDAADGDIPNLKIFDEE